jgi:subtilisin family serine protease
MITFRTSSVFTLVASLGLTLGCVNEDHLVPVSSSSTSAARAGAALADGAVRFNRGQYIIVGNTNLPADLDQQVTNAKGKLTAVLSDVGIATVTSTDPDFAAKASKIAGVRSVIPDFTAQWFDPTQKQIEFDPAFANPPKSGDNDRYFDLQWGHDAIDAPEAWNAGYRGKGVRVAVLDSGFDLDHPDLAPNIDLGASKNFVTGEVLQYAPNNTFSHGTHTAGTVAAADNGIGVIGVAPEAKLILVKVLRDSGSGSFSWMLSGIVHAVNQGADVISMSLGAGIPRNGKFIDDNGTPDDASDDFVVSDTKAVQELIVAINKVTTYAYQQGTTLIAAAGNDAINGNKDQSLVQIPADAPHVLSISATTPIGWAKNPTTTFLDNLASYSNYGTSEIDFAAPGGDTQYPGNELATIGGIRQYVYVFDLVFSTGNNGYYWSAGTSMATPHAAGVAALVIGKNGGQLDPAKVESALRASADDLGKPGRDPAYGHGRVNAFKAVSSTNL